MSHSIRVIEKDKTITSLQFGASQREMASLIYTVLDAEEYDAGVSGNGLERKYSKDEVLNAIKGIEYFKDENLSSFELKSGTQIATKYLDKVIDSLERDVRIKEAKEEDRNHEKVINECKSFLETIVEKMTEKEIKIHFG